MGRKKRHHYVPKFYLEGFIDPRNKPYIWIYEKGNSDIRKQKGENIAFEKHYYSFTEKSGEKDTETFENAFAELEDKTAPIFEKIKNGENLSDRENKILSLFIAFSMTRVPNYRKNVEAIGGKYIKTVMKSMASDSEGFKNEVKKYEKATGKKVKVPVEDMRQSIFSDEFDINVRPEFSLGMMGLARDLAPIFYAMNWAFLRATDEYKFLTSDNPLYYFNPKHGPKSIGGGGLEDYDTEVYFPISKDLMLFGNWKNYIGYFQIKNKAVRDINRRTVIFALRFVFSSQKSQGIKTLVQKYKNSHPKLFDLD